MINVVYLYTYQQGLLIFLNIDLPKIISNRRLLVILLHQIMTHNVISKREHAFNRRIKRCGIRYEVEEFVLISEQTSYL